MLTLLLPLSQELSLPPATPSESEWTTDDDNGQFLVVIILQPPYHFVFPSYNPGEEETFQRRISIGNSKLQDPVWFLRDGKSPSPTPTTSSPPTSSDHLPLNVS